MSDLNRNNKNEETAFSLLDIFVIILKHRWLIIASSFAAAVLILALSIFTITRPPDSSFNPLSNYYSSSVKIMIQPSGDSVASKISPSAVSPLSIFMGGVTAKTPQLVLAENLLEGNLIKDQIAKDFDLYRKCGLEEYKYKRSMVRKIIGSSLELEPITPLGSNIFVLRYTDVDPVFATQVLSRILELLEESFKELSLERVLRKKKFIEERLQAVEEELKKAQSDLVDFQLAYGITDIYSQSQEQAHLIANLQSDIIKNELEIKTLKEYLTERDPRIVRLKQEIEKKKQLISELRTGLKEFSGGFIPQNEIPNLTIKYLNLESEMEIQKSIYSMLREEYEKVKIEESDNSKTFQVINPVEVPERKAGPRRSIICMVVTIVTFILAIFWAFIKEYFEKVRRDPVESAKLGSIKAILRRKKKI